MNEPIPGERNRTVRQQLRALLRQGRFTAAELSRQARCPEKDIHEHLESLLRSGDITMLPAECRNCGQVFEERARARKPGKCPQCRATRIRAPAFESVG